MRIDRNSFLAGLVFGLALSYIVMSVAVMLAPKDRGRETLTPSAGGATVVSFRPSPAVTTVTKAAPTSTPAPSATEPPVPTATQSNTATGTATPSPTATPTGPPSPTHTPAPTKTPIPSPTDIPSPTLSPTAAPTEAPSPSPTAPAFHSESMKVPPRQSAVLHISAQAGQAIEIVVTVDTDIDLTLADPAGNIIVGPQRISGTYKVQQITPAAGDWVLKLDNSFSWISIKQVTVEYRILG